MPTDKSYASSDSDKTGSFSVDPLSNTTDKLTRFWYKYSKEAEDHDEDFIHKNGDNIEGVMLFAGLFSAVSASFLVNMQQQLKPDPTATTNALLMMLVHSVNNSAFADQDLGIPVWNGPSTAIVCSRVLGFAALSASLLAALGAVLGKQWLSDFTQLRSGPLQERCRKRQQRLDGLKAWKFEVFIVALPALIQLALLLFSIALAINMWEQNHAVGSVLIAATAFGALFYFSITLASLLFPTCPFQTPVSYAIRGATGIVMKSLEEVAEYWAWHTNKRHHRQPIVSRGNKILAYLTAVLFSPLLLTASTILLAMFAILGPLFVFIAWVWGRGVLFRAKLDSYCSAFQLTVLHTNFYALICWVRDSARRARKFMRSAYLDPDPNSINSDPHAIAWILETSTDPVSLMAAAELVPDVKWPKHLDISLPTEHLYTIFIRSIPEKTCNDNALPLGKALIIMLCHLSKVSTPVWRAALQRVTEESMNLDPDVNSDLYFILSIVTKLLSLKLGSEDCTVDIRATRAVSQQLLSWLLQPLESLILLEPFRQSRFLPEAYRAFLMLKWPEESKLEVIRRMQYFRTFEIYFNSVVGAKVEKMDEVTLQGSQEWNEQHIECLKRILEKLQQLNLSRLTDIHQHFIVPLTVLSRVASVSYLRRAFKGTAINHWIIRAFKKAVKDADENDESIWLFASCLMKLATVVDAFNYGTQAENPARSFIDSSGRGQTLMSTLRMDSKSLLSFLLNNGTPVPPEQAVYALQTMLSNVDELPELASNPDFVNYILYATVPGQVYSVRNVGLKVLIPACQYLLGTRDADGLVTLASQCDFVRFLRRAILNQDQPTILQDLLCRNDEEFNTNLLGILAPTLGDPFDTLMTKLNEDPNIIPERDLCDLEIALVLSNMEGRKKLLYDRLDSFTSPAQQANGRQTTMALPLAVIVGWLLRRDGPLSAAPDEGVWKAFLRPKFEQLLLPAWEDPEVLEENPQMLRLLLDCTARWLLAYTRSGDGTEESESPSWSPILDQLDDTLHQLRASRVLSFDIKRAGKRLCDEVQQFRLEHG